MRGSYIRSKIQWIEEGEKPSNFFLNLETKHFINKTIPKLVNEKGDTISEQDKILKEANNYYKRLYTKTESLNNVNLNNEIPDTDIKKKIIPLENLWRVKLLMVN